MDKTAQDWSIGDFQWKEHNAVKIKNKSSSSIKSFLFVTNYIKIEMDIKESLFKEMLMTSSSKKNENIHGLAFHLLKKKKVGENLVLYLPTQSFH